MNALEVIGAAVIWCLCGAGALYLGILLLIGTLTLLDRWKIHRAIWRFKTTGWVSEDYLDAYLRDCARDWYHERREQRCWSRSDDYLDGMRAAAKHLIRDYAHVIKDRETAPTTPSEPKP